MYMLDHYEVKAFVTSRYLLHDRHVLSRFRNLIVKAIEQEELLPKAILLILDDDLIRNVHYEEPDVDVTYKKILQWLSKEFHRVILAYKDILSNKSRKYKYPAVIWIAPPQNVNFLNNNLRKDFAGALEKAANNFPEFWSLQLKKIWEFDNPNYYDEDTNRYTAKGTKTYWEAIDSTFKFWDTNLNHKYDREDRRNHASSASKPWNKCSDNRRDQYHWSNKNRRN